jgi:hypothetical protein
MEGDRGHDMQGASEAFLQDAEDRNCMPGIEG